MGLFDNARNALQQAREKAEDVARNHGDTIKQGVDKAVDLADQRTSGKYRGQLEKARERAAEAVDDAGRQDSAPAPGAEAFERGQGKP